MKLSVRVAICLAALQHSISRALFAVRLIQEILASIPVCLGDVGEGDGGPIRTYRDKNEHVIRYLSTPFH
jgi:hypothetical protein